MANKINKHAKNFICFISFVTHQQQNEYKLLPDIGVVNKVFFCKEWGVIICLKYARSLNNLQEELAIDNHNQ